MSPKIHILFLLIFQLSFTTFAEEKFLRIKGELIDETTKEPISGFIVKQKQDEDDSSQVSFDKSTFDIWVPANAKTKVFFIKEGYVISHMLVDASFIPSRAYKKKQKIEALTVKMNKVRGSRTKYNKPILVAEYVAQINGFEVKDMKLKKNRALASNYKPPFPSPADTYINVKPSSNRLPLTTTVNEKKMKGNSGIARVLQGIIFADMNYCLFNERTNDANNYLEQLQSADNETWKNIEAFDAPEYGRIVTRTVNREQSIDTLFALGAYIETSRLIFQDFTSDSKVLVHLKSLKKVLNAFKPELSTPEVESVLKGLSATVSDISSLEKKYRDKLKNKLNFEMQADESFKSIQSQINKVYEEVIS